MEILTPEPQIEKIPTPGVVENSAKVLSAGVDLKNAEFLAHLGLQYEMFNPQVIEKVQYLADNLADVKALQALDIKIGDGGNIPRIDKIFAYMKIQAQSREMQEQKALLDERLQRYERS